MNYLVKQILICCLLIFSTLLSFGQNCSALFTSVDSNLLFKISLNRKEQHRAFTNNIRLNGLEANNKYFIEINFKDDSTSFRKTLYLLDDNLIHLYEVSKKGLQLKKMLPEISYTKTTPLIANYKENEDFIAVVATKDTIKDTTYIPPFDSYYELKDYNGKIGCPWPIKEDVFADLRTIILNEKLEESKLEKIKISIQEMDSACVMVDQTKELIMFFEFEETRLDFAKFMFAFTFDIDNYGKLNEAFNFENSKEELKALIKK